MIETILITNDVTLAKEAEAAGVSRIMVDLESMGKKERQASRTTFLSSHQPEDVALMRAAISKAKLIVRVNPWHGGSAAEIETAVEAGADFIMLPMIEDLVQLHAFTSVLEGRAKALPLIETKYSMEKIAAIAAHPEVPEVYIGLNDLHLSLGMEFLFEPLARGLVDQMAQIVRAKGKPFGFGGIGALGGAAELPPERILAEHARLGSTRVILSSRFAKDVRLEDISGRAARLKTAVNSLQEKYAQLKQRSSEEVKRDTISTAEIIDRLAGELKKKRQASAN